MIQYLTIAHFIKSVPANLKMTDLGFFFSALLF